VRFARAGRAFAGMASLILASVVFAASGRLHEAFGWLHAARAEPRRVACFVLGAVLLTRAVSRGNLSTTYILGLGIEAVASITVGLLVLGEHMTAPQLMGIALIMCGRVVIHTG
jgi:multidrug transporter EmrE-like cation transporter